MTTPNNPPAFPSEVEGLKCTEAIGKSMMKYSGPHPGMSLRDWFAGMALQGQLSDSYVRPESKQELAENCYSWADAMLTEREKGLK